MKFVVKIGIHTTKNYNLGHKLGNQIVFYSINYFTKCELSFGNFLFVEWSRDYRFCLEKLFNYVEINV